MNYKTIYPITPKYSIWKYMHVYKLHTHLLYTYKDEYKNSIMLDQENNF